MFDFKQKIGQKIRLLRQEKGYSQESMAEMLDMSLSGFAKMERGETDISASRIEQIAKVFLIEPLDLLMRGENTNIANFNHSHLFNGINYGSLQYMDRMQELNSLKNILQRFEQRIEMLEKKLENKKNE